MSCRQIYVMDRSRPILSGPCCPEGGRHRNEVPLNGHDEG
jgi:hypothetical protein